MRAVINVANQTAAGATDGRGKHIAVSDAFLAGSWADAHFAHDACGKAPLNSTYQKFDRPRRPTFPLDSACC